MNEATKIDELVWSLGTLAHQAIDKQELHEYYPELKPFLEYIARTYPAKVTE